MRRASTSSAPRECCRAEARRHRETRSRHCCSTFAARRSLRSSLPSPPRCSTGPIIAGVTASCCSTTCSCSPATRSVTTTCVRRVTRHMSASSSTSSKTPTRFRSRSQSSSRRPAPTSRHESGSTTRSLPADAGRLFFVGDPKQSIYRFRRADVELYRRAQDVFADPALHLTENFRTVASIVDFINTLFDSWMNDADAGCAARLRGAHPARARPRARAPPSSRSAKSSPTFPPPRCGLVKPKRSCGSSRRRSAKGGWSGSGATSFARLGTPTSRC